MCGRYSTAKIPKKKFEEKLGISLENYSPSFNACPGMPHPVIAFKGDMTKTSNMYWGLIPQWAKVHNPKIKPINARSETLSQKPTFRNLISRKRCLVPAAGYYEWQSGGIGKIPHFIYASDHSPLAFGGLYDTWNEGQENSIHSYSIITKTASQAIHFIHDRMPVVVPERHWMDWLDPELSVDSVNQIIKNSMDHFSFHPVSVRVNNPKNDSPDLIEPV